MDNTDKLRGDFEKFQQTHDYDHIVVDLDIDLDKALEKVWLAASEAKDKELAELRSLGLEVSKWADRLSFELVHDENYETSDAFSELQDAIYALKNALNENL